MRIKKLLAAGLIALFSLLALGCNHYNSYYYRDYDHGHGYYGHMSEGYGHYHHYNSGPYNGSHNSGSYYGGHGHQGYYGR